MYLGSHIKSHLAEDDGSIVAKPLAVEQSPEKTSSLNVTASSKELLHGLAGRLKAVSRVVSKKNTSAPVPALEAAPEPTVVVKEVIKEVHVVKEVPVFIYQDSAQENAEATVTQDAPADWTVPAAWVAEEEARTQV